MARFSIGTAVGAGFSLIKRRPLAVFVWGLLTVIPAAASMGAALPMMGSIMENAAHGDPESMTGSNPVMAEMMRMQGAMSLMSVVRFVLGVVIYTAIIRAVVRPKESSFFSLRVGMDELRVFVVSLALIVGLFVAVLLVAVVGGLVGAGLWPTLGAARGAVAVLLVIACIVGGLLLGGRLSLLVPATVRLRTFAFAEGWNMGKGHSWALVGVMLLLMLIIIGLEIVVGGIGVGVMFAVLGASDFDPSSWANGANPFADLSATASANWPWLVVAALVGAAVYGMLTAIVTAPFASVVGQLSKTDEADVF